MKRIVFVCSHPYSGSAALCEAMGRHSRIQLSPLSRRRPYSHPLSLRELDKLSHKMHNTARLYLDELLYNQDLATKVAYKECRFVYVVREPEPVLNFLVGNERKEPSFAVRQYTFRLRRLCEMARRTPGAVLLTWNDLVTGRGISIVEAFLGLKEPIPFDPALLAPFMRTSSSELVEPSQLAIASDAYERYFYYLKNQKLILAEPELEGLLG